MRFASPTSRSRLKLRIAWLDILWALAAPILAVALRDPSLLVGDRGDPTSIFIFIAVAVVAGLLSLIAFRVSDGMRHVFTVHDLLAVAGAVGLSVALTSVIMFTFTRLDGVPRSTPAIYAMVFGGGLILLRALLRAYWGDQSRRRASAEPELLRNVLVVGADRFAVGIAELMASQTPRTARVVALLDDDLKSVGRTLAGVRVVGTTADIEQVLDEYRVHGVAIDQILISNPAALADEAIGVLDAVCVERDIPCLDAAEAFNLKPMAAPDIVERAAVGQPTTRRYFEVKRLFDFVAAVFLLILLSPLTVIVCLLVLVDVGTPLLFWQERLGRGGRRFLVYKFRTYRAPFDWNGEAVPDDQRLSRLGRFIRATRLDEIPQLLNILVGDMSLIGPRPLLPHDQPGDPTLRLQVPPGITGWAQVNGGNLVTAEEKDALDIWYIKNASWRVDLRIVWLTLLVATSGERRDSRAVEEALALQEAQSVAICRDGLSHSADA